MKTLLLALLAGIAVSTASTACPVFQKPEPVAVLSEIDAALHRAAREGNAEEIEALLKAGADVNAKGRRGETALQLAAKEGSTADVHAKDHVDYTALLYAANNGHTDAVKALLAAGAAPNFRREGGFTALFLAATRGEAEMVKALLDAGADPNARSLIHPTALMEAARKGSAEMVKALLDAGADPNERNTAEIQDRAEINKTALDYTSNDEIKALLRKAGAKGDER